MSIEAECFKIKRRGENTLIRSDRVLRGNSERLPYLQNVQILATCDVDDYSGTVRLKTQIRRSRRLSVKLFENSDDLEGRKVPYNQPIKITGEQELSIFHRTERKEIMIYLNQESGSSENAPSMDIDRLVPVT